MKSFSFLLGFALGAFGQPYDLVIRNGHIIDGTGSPWYSGDIAIQGGRIAGIGQFAASAGKRAIDARGMVVAPGFIDMLGQSELTLLVNPPLPSKNLLGMPTALTRQSGSIAPPT